TRLTRHSRIVTAVQTRLAYDVEMLSPPSLKNVTEGLRNNSISMVRCYERNSDFHFELQERIHVTIPDGGDPTCSTCPTNERRACRHIWWVDDQILSTAVPPEARSRFKYQISRNGEAVREAEAEDGETLIFHSWLQEKGLGNLARRAGWWKQDPMDQQDTRLVEQTATHILSAFEPCGVLSKQHGQDNFEILQQESHDGNLDATAEALRVEIDRMRSFIMNHGQKKMSIPLQTRIAGILLYTLEQLVQYAGDIQTNAAVSIPQYSGLSLQDRSLLHKMIDRNSPIVFVLPVLDLLDSKVLYGDMIQERVEVLANGLREGEEPCPAEYIRLLERVVGLVE
ncbi:unnamed protein product, partial [Aureobasidium vineae]